MLPSTINYSSILTVKALVRLAVSLCLMFSVLANGSVNVVIISSVNNDALKETISIIEEKLLEAKSDYKFEHVFLHKINNQKGIDESQADLIVTLGSKAASYAAKNIIQLPIINGYITRNSFESIIRSHNKKNKISAVFIDQTQGRLLDLAALLRVDQSTYRVAMLSHAPALTINNNIRQKFFNRNIEITSEELISGDNPIKKIEPLIRNSDVFIVRPGSGFLNRLVAKLVLQLSMKYKVPVIGFSENYADAGALLSMYASPSDVGVDVAKIISDWQGSKRQDLPEPMYGDQFSIKVNSRVAKKLNRKLDSEELKARIKIDSLGALQ